MQNPANHHEVAQYQAPFNGKLASVFLTLPVTNPSFFQADNAMTMAHFQALKPKPSNCIETRAAPGISKDWRYRGLEGSICRSSKPVRKELLKTKDSRAIIAYLRSSDRQRRKRNNGLKDDEEENLGPKLKALKPC
ncbi:hypothetical protein L6164_005670 [Bauhinia variegata]|uniref:Uncharacterized protein n=1 Tax=Bauhinia variegata TaxID=167791 RepID=A0ACB9PTG5_BAUVA|nr:hypothetical protein L6164_005670 [Bauhinia variegata]